MGQIQTTDINNKEDFQQDQDVMICILAELQKIKKQIKQSNDKLDTLIAKP